MAAKEEFTKSQELENENACVVCFKQSLIYSIGSCNHAVCYECSARMRCLLLQNECPICRQDLPKVIFTRAIAPFATLDRELRSGLYEKKYRIAFESLDMQKSFYRLLEHRCPICDHTPFVEFQKLKEHVRKAHEMFYCEICTDNLKIFSSERRCYTRPDLATHRRLGDANDKSHKGHPRCEYCELRFLDKDELFRHLRREHYFCHLCDADGINVFYGSINEMRDHFKAEHFLCEEDECADEQFTAVFRTEIDLRAHIATIHSRGMSRADLKQARTLDLEFSYTPRGRGDGGQDRDRRGGRIRTNDTQREFDRIPEQTVVQQKPIQIDAKNEEQFPKLGGPSAPPAVQLANTVRHISYGTSGLARTKENFPALGQETAPMPRSQPVTGKGQSKMPSASSLLKGQSKPKQKSASTNGIKQNASDFPALSQSTAKNSFDFPAFAPAVKKPQPAKPIAQTAPVKQKDFPALSSKKNRKNADELMEDLIEPTTSVNMNLVKSKHRGLVEDYVSMASKVSKVQTVQQKDVTPATTSAGLQNVPKLNSIDNFPTLGGDGGLGGASAPQWLIGGRPEKTKKSKVHEMPVVQKEKTAQNGFQESTKKEKSKNNNKENKNENLSVPAPPPEFSKKPPPGFNLIAESSDYTYQPPPNAKKRNQALVGEFQKAMSTNESMQEFRHVSQMFREGNYFAKSYYETCKHVLGSSFDTIFPELIALLPDIDKQQGLYQAHIAATSENNTGAKKKNKTKELDCCATCKQVLLKSDLLTHVQSHTLENNFPSLSTASPEPSTVKQWKK